MEAGVAMLRLFRYDNCSEFTDYPDDLFRRTDLSLSFQYEEDKVNVNQVTYRLSSILHLKGTGSRANSIETSLFIKLRNNLRAAIQNLLKC
jgi:hypothetical protein